MGFRGCECSFTEKMYKVMDLVFEHWQDFIVCDETPSGEKILKILNGKKPDFRSIALSISIDRVAKATLIRGIWP